MSTYQAVPEQEIREAAERRGEADGKARGSRYFDGNTEASTYAAVLRGIREGDSAVLDTFPHADLSGEWADVPAGPEVTRDILDDAGVEHSEPGDNHAPGTCDRCDWLEWMGTVLDWYEDAHAVAVQSEIERMALAQVAAVRSGDGA